jgi:predicted dienelactone hydrolase
MMTWTRASSTTGEPRELETHVWYPSAGGAPGEVRVDADPGSGGPFPVVLFSHGHSGDPLNAEYLMEHLASWGYVVAAPPHPGNTAVDCGYYCGVETIADSAQNRVPDLEFVLDSLLALREDDTSPLGAIIDEDRAAVVGHSFGGWTAIEAGPGGRFDAIAALAPAAIILGDAPRDTHVPVMFIASRRDEVIPIIEIDRAWVQYPTGADNVYIEFPEGGHTSFTNTCFPCQALDQTRARELVQRYVTAFLQVHIQGDRGFASFLEASPPDAVVRELSPIVSGTSQ